MKKNTIPIKLILLVIITVLCCSCGSAFKSVKDADDYVKISREEVTRKAINGNGDVYAWTPNIKVEKSAPGSIALLGLGLLTASVPLDYVAAGVYAPTTLIGVSEELKNRPITGKLISIKSQLSTTLIVSYRKEPGKPEWDLKKEAFKKVGELPVRNAGCVVKKFDPLSDILKKEYKGEDGEITIHRMIFPDLWIYGKPNTEPACTMEDILIYKGYMTNLTMAMAQIVKEEVGKLDEIISEEHGGKVNHQTKTYWYDRGTKKE
jgi:hypothetical protein